jgi:hypothetical protein
MAPPPGGAAPAAAIGGVLALAVGLHAASKVMEALPRRGDAPREN